MLTVLPTARPANMPESYAAGRVAGSPDHGRRLENPGTPLVDIDPAVLSGSLHPAAADLAVRRVFRLSLHSPHFRQVVGLPCFTELLSTLWGADLKCLQVRGCPPPPPSLRFKVHPSTLSIDFGLRVARVVLSVFFSSRRVATYSAVLCRVCAVHGAPQAAGDRGEVLPRRPGTAPHWLSLCPTLLACVLLWLRSGVFVRCSCRVRVCCVFDASALMWAVCAVPLCCAAFAMLNCAPHRRKSHRYRQFPHSAI